MTSSIDVKTEPHEGRNKSLSISMHRYNRVGTNEVDKVALGECLRLSVLLKDRVRRFAADLRKLQYF